MRVRGSLALLLVSGALLTACGDERDTSPDTADLAGPHVETISPSAPTTLGPTGAIAVTFSEPVDPASVTDQSVTVGGLAATRSVQGAVVTLRPAASWPPGASLTVAVTSSVRDLAGNAAAPWSAAVTTAP